METTEIDNAETVTEGVDLEAYLESFTSAFKSIRETATIARGAAVAERIDVLRAYDSGALKGRRVEQFVTALWSEPLVLQAVVEVYRDRTELVANHLTFKRLNALYNKVVDIEFGLSPDDKQRASLRKTLAATRSVEFWSERIWDAYLSM